MLVEGVMRKALKNSAWHVKRYIRTILAVVAVVSCKVTASKNVRV